MVGEHLFILSEGHRASQETVQEQGTLRLDFPFCPKDTEQVKRLCKSKERYAVWRGPIVAQFLGVSLKQYLRP